MDNESLIEIGDMENDLEGEQKIAPEKSKRMRRFFLIKLLVWDSECANQGIILILDHGFVKQ